MRAKLVAANWKMHGSLAANDRLLRALKARLVATENLSYAVCVPFPYLAQAREILSGSGIAWGAQNVSEHDRGAYTGEVSAAMLVEFGCRYAIVGHSERRRHEGESDARVAAKFAAAKRAGLVPILCIGETLDEREQKRTEAVLRRQLDAVLEANGIAAFAGAVIAYEPVWAIGTGRTATPAQAQEAQAFIRALLGARDAVTAHAATILYGGSVRPDNARGLFAMPDVDGALVGGASLEAADFVAICEAARETLSGRLAQAARGG